MSVPQERAERRAVIATERLAEHWLEGLKARFVSSLTTSPEAETWEAVVTAMATWLDERRAFELDPRNLAHGYASDLFVINARLIGVVIEALMSKSSGPAGERFKVAVGKLADDTASWGRTFDADAAAFLEHAALVWVSLWHLAAAQVPPSKARDLVAGAVGRGVPPPIKVKLKVLPDAVHLTVENRFVGAEPRPATTEALAAVMANVGNVMGQVGARLKDQAVEFQRRAVDANRKLREARANARAEQALREQQEREARRAAEEARQAEFQSRIQQGDGAATPSVLAGTLSLKAGSLHRSILPTWLGLVALSWVGLLWGGFLITPFFGPFFAAAFVTFGIVGIPLFATFFGFIGMGPARDSTLRKMGFTKMPEDYQLTGYTRDMAKALGIPMPQLGIVSVHNAFAMGSSPTDATVAIGQPLIDRLEQREVMAVIGHELGHVVFGDMQRMMLMRTFQNATVFYMLAQGAKQFARWFICWAAELYILAFSRRREFWADAVGAALVGKDAMIGALRKLEQGPALTSAENTHARFMFRGNPFSTHPSTASRIEALERETYLRRLPISC